MGQGKDPARGLGGTMSAMCVFTPVIVEVAWPVVSALATAALTGAGYKVVGEAANVQTLNEHRVELEVKQNGEFNKSVGEGGEVVLRKGKITLTFKKGADGRLKVCASAAGMSEAELKKVGQDAMNAFLQAYVRERVAVELKKRGFKLEEQRLSDGSIRLKAKKWGKNGTV